MSAELEALRPLATVQAIAAAKWDSLGQWICIDTELGVDDGPRLHCWISLKPEAAQRLLRELQRVLAERPDEAWTRQ